MLRRMFPIPVPSNLEMNQDKWTISIVYDENSKNTQLVVQGLMEGNQQFVKSLLWNQKLAKVELNDGLSFLKVNDDNKPRPIGQTFQIGRKRAQDFICRMMGDRAYKAVSPYTLQFSSDNPAEASYRWARNRLLSARPMTSLDVVLGDFIHCPRTQHIHTQPMMALRRP